MYAGYLQSERLHARATDFKSREPLIGLGAYCLGAYIFERPILDLATFSLDQEPAMGIYMLGISQPNHWTKNLQSERLHARKPIIGLGAYSLRVYLIERPFWDLIREPMVWSVHT